jgi:hypothetical protein
MKELPIEKKTEKKIDHKTKENESDDEDYDKKSFDNEFRTKDQNSHRDELSKKMGEFMLQGWAMLAEYCEGFLNRLHAPLDEEGR